MRCINSSYQTENVIKKSRFIAYLLPCASEAEVIQQLQLLQLEYANASHIAFAYRLQTEKGLKIRFNDAGEPGGTAGKPILMHLQGQDLVNVLAAVVRYFGGIKLGAGGLTRAYGNAAKQVIEIADIVDYIEYETLHYLLEYRQMQSFEYHLKKLDGTITSKYFSDAIQLVISLPSANALALQQLFPLLKT